MNVTFDFDGTVALVTGASDTPGGAIAYAFYKAGVSVATADVVKPDSEDGFFGTEEVRFYEGGFTNEDDVARVIDEIVSDFGRLNHLANITGTWHGETPIGETGTDTFDFLFDVNLKTVFLASKRTIPHLRETEGSVVSVLTRLSLEGGEGDGIYRASKVGIRLLIEAIAEENRGGVRANAVMPSVIDTSMNHETIADADFDSRVKPAEIARTVLALHSDTIPMTSSATIPMYGEA